MRPSGAAWLCCAAQHRHRCLLQLVRSPHIVSVEIFCVFASHAARYEVLLSIKPSSACPFKTSDFSRVFMGHMETSKVSASDPALSRSIKELADLPELRMPADLLEATSFDATKRLLEQTCSSSRRARMKDMCWDNGDAVLSKPAV
jgi:hypothetical protein